MPCRRSTERADRYRTGTFAAGLSLGREPVQEAAMNLGKGCLLWLVGIPIPVIILLLIFFHH
jgi:hypothetical protein